MAFHSMRIAALVLVFCTTTAFADGMSGTYVGKGGNAAFLFQVVQIDGRKLTGRYEEGVLQADGKLVDNNFEFTGATDGKTVAGTIKQSGLLESSIPVSGTFDGTTFHLTTGASLKRNLTKSEEATFRVQVDTLTNQANQTEQAKIDGQKIAALHSVIQRLHSFTDRTKVVLERLSPVSQELKDLTSQMSVLLTREQSIRGDGQRSVARGQISGAIFQKAGAASQIHVRVQSSNEDIAGKARLLQAETSNASKTCHEQHPASQTAWNLFCGQFTDAETEFQQSVRALQTAFSNIELVWQSENQIQETIMHSSDIAIK